MASMTLDTLAPGTAGETSPQLRSRTAEEELCLALPRQDPIAAQKLLCEALARLAWKREPDDRQLGALLVFDRYAQPIGRRLLVQYCEGDAQLRSLDRRFFIAAQRLCRSFAEAYERHLPKLGSPAEGARRTSAGTALIHYFRHRQVDLLLRLFRYKKRNSEQWQQLNAAFRTAQAQVLSIGGSPSGLAEEGFALEQTLQREFIQILLLGAMNTGQFSPRELLWANDWIARWRSLLALRSVSADGEPPGERRVFAVDLSGGEGLKRFRAADAGDFLQLDTTPLMRAIEDELAALTGASAVPDAAMLTERDGREALLSKLRMLFAPDPLHVERRGDRKPVALTLQTISGLPQIVQVLREEAHRQGKRLAASAAQLEDITISPSSGHTRISATLPGAAGLAPLSIVTAFGAKPQLWQAKDRSDSGCRLRGQTSDLNSLIPGSLMAIREAEDAQWTVAVVRRLRRLMVDHVELGVEHIGRKPRFVKMVTDWQSSPSDADLPKDRRKCFGALYLPASEKHPTMPIKTLVVPAVVFKAGRVVTLLSSTATYTLRLNNPLEQQSDFVWTSFAVIDKAVAPSH
jgi:cyclic-di-GMP-binding protein